MQAAFLLIFPDLFPRRAYSQFFCPGVQLHLTFSDLLGCTADSSFRSAVRTGCGPGDAFQATNTGRMDRNGPSDQSFSWNATCDRIDDHRVDGHATRTRRAVDIGASSARKRVLLGFPFCVAEHRRCRCSGRFGRHEHRRTWHVPHSCRTDPATRASGSPPRLCPADISRSSRNRSPSP